MARHDLVPAPPSGIGFAMSITPPTPLIDVEGWFAVTPEALLDWAAEAEEGARCVYARVENIAMYPRLRDKVATLAAAGVIVLAGQARYAADSSLRDHIAKRSCVRAPAIPGGVTPPDASGPGGGGALRQAQDDRALELDAAAALIFQELAQAARRGQRCPSDLDLARAAGLATRNQAAWRVRKLASAGRIEIETVTGPDRLPWRIVTVGRQRTKAPA